MQAVSMSPTVLSLRRLRDEGWTVDIVERWVPNPALPGGGVRRDLFGFLDLVAVRDGETLGVQTTSYTNVSAHLRKIADAEHIGAVREAGWRLVVHGWRKVGHRWVVREVDVS